MWVQGWGELPGRLIVVSGPSGSGKSTVIRTLMERSPGRNLRLSVSATSRAPRPDEEHGRDYIFLSLDQFLRARDAGEFLEWAVYNGNHYGTPARPVFESLQKGQCVLLEIETQGAMLVREKAPTALFVFVDVSDFRVLARRLCDRGTESDVQIHQRLVIARKERDLAHCYDVRIVNDDLEQAVAELARVLDQAGCVDTETSS